MTSPDAGPDARPDVLSVEQDGPVWIATLNRPAKANALSGELIDALDAFAASVEQHWPAPDGPRAVVITGAGGRIFSAGADINELDTLDVGAARAKMRRGQLVFSRIEHLPTVVIAALPGAALGGGLELAMAADIRIAAPTARLGQPEITLQNVPGWGGTQRLPRLVGRGIATELILTGEPISADRAAALGLVNHVEDDPIAAARKMARQIAVRSREAIAGAKRAIAGGLIGGVAVGLEIEADAVAQCCQTPEQHRAVREFLNRKAMRK